MQSRSNVEIADRISRNRAVGAAAAAGIFLFIQVLLRPFFVGGPQSSLTMWAINAVALLLLLTGRGGFGFGKDVRALVNDEVSRANYKTAVNVGFWVAMIIAMTLYVLAADPRHTAREAVYYIVTPSVAVALLTASWLELRAHRNA
jgi:hypothetical protein